MFNPSIGDALSSLIATESLLKVLDFSIEDVYLMYKELRSLNTKISVKDKSIFKCNDNKTKLIQPENLQIIIDQLFSKFNQTRALIKPSETEDVVRIYQRRINKKYKNRIINN